MAQTEVTAEDYFRRGQIKLWMASPSGAVFSGEPEPEVARLSRQAIDNFSRALAINPNYADAYRGRGTANKYLLNYRDAFNDFQKALNYQPCNREVVNNLNWTIEEMNEKARKSREEDLINLDRQCIQAEKTSISQLLNVARSITVRIEGATQGSGVLISREGDRYTVLTAWHVISENHLGEEVAIFTPDNDRYTMLVGSAKRLGNLDLGIFNFISNSRYKLAKIGNFSMVIDRPGLSSSFFRNGEHYGQYNLFISGFPIKISGYDFCADSVDSSRYCLSPGTLVVNTGSEDDQGYELLYTNSTERGMSGGAILNINGELVGIHGRGQLDNQATDRMREEFKLATNKGIPISYYSRYKRDGFLVNPENLMTFFEYFVQRATVELVPETTASYNSPQCRGTSRCYEREKIRIMLANAVLNQPITTQIEESYKEELAWIYRDRAYARISIGEVREGCRDYQKSSVLSDLGRAWWISYKEFVKCKNIL